MATRKKAKAKTGLSWQLSGPCPSCAAPVFYAFKGKEIHVRRTCFHNTSYNQWGYSFQQPYTVWGSSGLTGYSNGGSFTTVQCASAPGSVGTSSGTTALYGNGQAQ